MENHRLSRRQLCGRLLAASVAPPIASELARLTRDETSAGRAPSPSLQVIRRPCSLRKICQALSRCYQASVEPDPELEDLRVVWAYRAEPSLEMLLVRLAELTDCRVVKSLTASGKIRYRLERQAPSRGLEARWRKESLAHTLAELLRAADENVHGTLNQASYSKNIQSYLQMGRAGQIQYLKRLTPDQTERLLQGERVQFTPGQVSTNEVDQIIQERYSGPGHEDERAEDLQRYQEKELQSVQQYGLALQIDFARKGWMFYLELVIGQRGANALSGFGVDEVGLPLTRGNPYRWLESPARRVPAPSRSPALDRRLEADLALPEGKRSLEDAVQALARVTGLELVSDAYLCRLPSRVYVRTGEKLVLAGRGVSASEALDLIGQRYGYLWWEDDGCCYLRSRTWPWDQLYEVPDSFLEQWTTAVRRGAIEIGEIASLASLTRLQLNGLGDLGGGVSLNRCNLDHEEVQQFLHLFLNSTPARRMQLLGDGLLVLPELLPGHHPQEAPTSPDAVPRPELLRLTRQIVIDNSSSPPLARVSMRVTHPQDPATWQPEFVVEIPQGAGQLIPPEIASGQPIQKGEVARTSN